jgi:hypothetical protein
MSYIRKDIRSKNFDHFSAVFYDVLDQGDYEPL